MEPAGVDDLLAQMLGGIYKGVEAAEARRLASRLLGTAWSSARGHTPPRAEGGDDAIEGLDVVLAAAKKASGTAGVMRVEDAKQWLRGHGDRGTRAASLLGKLSKPRNRQCHPIARQLVVEIGLLGGEGCQGGAEEHSTELSDTEGEGNTEKEFFTDERGEKVLKH